MYYINLFLPFIFILGTAVVLHEFGHFIVAKMLGIRVETFSVGFGPRLFGRRWGTTDYRVSAIPLGGYVKLGGDESNAAIEGESETNIPEKERFDLRPRWHKFLVAIAGPVMNILTALAIPFAAALMYGVPAMPTPVVSYVRPNGTAAVAGIKSGDRIVMFNGEENPTWSYIEKVALLNPNLGIPFTVERNGQLVNMNIMPKPVREGDQVVGELEFSPDFGFIPVSLQEVEPNTPASEAGLQKGDHIVSIGNETTRNVAQVHQYIQDHANEPMALSVERRKSDTANTQLERVNLTVTPRVLADGQKRLGIKLGFADVPTEKVGVPRAMSYAVEKNVEFITMTGMAFGQIFKGQRSVRDTLSGPIGIAQESARAANEFGWAGVITMLALISLNLGIVNLLPIPVLDGGMITLLFIEALLALVGVSLTMRVRERIQQVGFVFILLLMGFVITNDLLRMVSSRRNSNQPAATQQK
ncbi:MAG: RIP metalloprotease RseP [Pyrinomonadaceae bacterium]